MLKVGDIVFIGDSELTSYPTGTICEVVELQCVGDDVKVRVISDNVIQILEKRNLHPVNHVCIKNKYTIGNKIATKKHSNLTDTYTIHSINHATENYECFDSNKQGLYVFPFDLVHNDFERVQQPQQSANKKLYAYPKFHDAKEHIKQEYPCSEESKPSFTGKDLEPSIEQQRDNYTHHLLSEWVKSVKKEIK
jgi:hypothetical protein